MADEIRIVLPYVRDLHDRVEETAQRLRGDIGDVGHTLGSDPQTQGRLDDFMGEWDKRRGQVADTLDAVGSALHAIDESFTNTDDQLAGQLIGR